MFSNLYPLSNTAFINLGRAQFLCDLITEVSIDICAHIFQTIGKTVARSAARTCILFCSLIMKIVLLEGVRPLTDEKIVPRPPPISMITLQASKSHSSKAPKSEPFTHATPSGHVSAPVHIETVSPIPFEMQTTGTPSAPSSQVDKLSTLIKSMSQQISGLERLLYSTKNQVQLCLTTIETQLDAIQQKLEESLQLFVTKRKRQITYSKGESNTRGRSVHTERGSCLVYSYFCLLFYCFFKTLLLCGYGFNTSVKLLGIVVYI